MSKRQNPSVSSGTASNGEFLAAFRLPQPRTRQGYIRSFISSPIYAITFLSAADVAILYISFLLQGTLILSSALLLVAAFLLACSIYSLNKVTDLKEDAINLPDRGRSIMKNRDYLLFASVESINIAVVLALFSYPSAIIVILFAFFVAFFYSLGTRRFRLKNILFLKNITIAGTVTATAVLLTLAVQVNIAFIVVMVTYFIFVKVLIGSVLLDVRDIEGDRKASVRTIPVSLGRTKTRNLLLLLNSTLVLWVAFSMLQAIFYPYIIVLILGVIYGYWSILRFTRAGAETSRFYYSLIGAEWMFLALYATPFALGWPHIL
ncbi:MAG: UbiA family prenyltransferase [Halobacteriota archaeon]